MTYTEKLTKEIIDARADLKILEANRRGYIKNLRKNGCSLLESIIEHDGRFKEELRNT